MFALWPLREDATREGELLEEMYSLCRFMRRSRDGLGNGWKVVAAAQPNALLPILRFYAARYASYSLSRTIDGIATPPENQTVCSGWHNQLPVCATTHEKS